MFGGTHALAGLPGLESGSTPSLPGILPRPHPIIRHAQQLGARPIGPDQPLPTPTVTGRGSISSPRLKTAAVARSGIGHSRAPAKSKCSGEISLSLATKPPPPTQQRFDPRDFPPPEPTPRAPPPQPKRAPPRPAAPRPQAKKPAAKVNRRKSKQEESDSESSESEASGEPSSTSEEDTDDSEEEEAPAPKSKAKPKAKPKPKPKAKQAAPVKPPPKAKKGAKPTGKAPKAAAKPAAKPAKPVPKPAAKPAPKPKPKGKKPEPRLVSEEEDQPVEQEVFYPRSALGRAEELKQLEKKGSRERLVEFVLGRHAITKNRSRPEEEVSKEMWNTLKKWRFSNLDRKKDRLSETLATILVECKTIRAKLMTIVILRTINNYQSMMTIGPINNEAPESMAELKATIRDPTKLVWGRAFNSLADDTAGKAEALCAVVDSLVGDQEGGTPSMLDALDNLFFSSRYIDSPAMCDTFSQIPHIDAFLAYEFLMDICYGGVVGMGAYTPTEYAHISEGAVNGLCRIGVVTAEEAFAADQAKLIGHASLLSVTFKQISAADAVLSESGELDGELRIMENALREYDKAERAIAGTPVQPYVAFEPSEKDQLRARQAWSKCPWGKRLRAPKRPASGAAGGPAAKRQNTGEVAAAPATA